MRDGILMSLALPCSCGRERDYFDNVFDPALKAAGSSIEYLGELAQSDRDTLLSTSYAALMPAPGRSHSGSCPSRRSHVPRR